MGPAASYRSLATWRDCGIQPSRKHWSLVMADKPRTELEKALTDWIATGMPAKLICQQEDCHDVDLAAEGFKAGYVAALRQSAAQKEEEVKCSVFGARCKCCYPFTDADK